ncbi:MAG: hypothetical protein O2873_06500, partial [Proteobacteria bacterium]|nr:hypothetical protein [Pseudomonadota bacterium]
LQRRMLTHARRGKSIDTALAPRPYCAKLCRPLASLWVCGDHAAIGLGETGAVSDILGVAAMG